MRQARGFTLIELLITVVVLGILAAIALPSYTSYITRSKLTEAHSQLSDLRVKLEQRFQDARSYANCGTIVAAATGTKYFDYTCPAVADPVNTFIIQAAGKAGTELEGIAFTITETAPLPQKRGHGLRIISGLMDSVDIRSDDQGTTVVMTKLC